MRVVIVGLGVQGRKRRRCAEGDVVATVDPLQPDADCRKLDEVDPSRYDAALLCVPDAAKLELIEGLLSTGKHVLVEKPLLPNAPADLARLARLAERAGAVCYTAYNHRFEPHFVRVKQALDSGRLGRIYLVRAFYGNGTAREVRASPWRDTGTGVLADLGSHLLDTILCWLGPAARRFELSGAHRFENRALDHVSMRCEGEPVIELEATLVSWRNHLTVDVFGERGSVHDESLCKWGPSTFTERTRVLPSGRPPENALVLTQPDPTWELEYRHFAELCARGHGGNLANDAWIADVLADLTRQAEDRFGA